ncbi:MAG: hypothetical protein EBZ69_00510 [Alphaproteobacteria bacterium]|nr:hypothetical protein [Alphaproteobacteria bacterium]
MAKKFPKKNSKKTHALTRKYLFEIIWSAVESLDKNLTSDRADKFTNTQLVALGQILCGISDYVSGRLGSPANIKKKARKKPRLRARLKG